MQSRGALSIIAVFILVMVTASAQTRSDADGAYNRAREWYIKGDFDRAIENFTRAIELSSHPDYRNGGRRQNWNEEMHLTNADSHSAAIVMIDPLTALAFEGRALARFRTGDTEAAIADSDRAIAINPGLGALADFDQALQLDPRRAEFYSDRGEAREEMGNVDDALRDLDQAVALDPRLARAYHCRAMVWRDKNDLNRAVADMTRAIEVDPQFAVAFANRGLIRLALGEEDKAERDFAESLRLDASLKQTLEQRIQTQKANREKRQEK